MVSPPDSPLRYSEWFIGDKPSRMNLANPAAWDDWHNPDLMDYQNYFYDHIDGAVSILYEYHLGMAKREPPMQAYPSTLTASPLCQ